MNVSEARTSAAEYIAGMIEQAYEGTSIQEIQDAFDVNEGDAMSILFELGSANAEIFWTTACGDGDCTCVDDDADMEDYEEGDPDPTLAYGDDYPCCRATNGLWLCTRLSGHSGQHIAGDGVEVCDVWND